MSNAHTEPSATDGMPNSRTTPQRHQFIAAQFHAVEHYSQARDDIRGQGKLVHHLDAALCVVVGPFDHADREAHQLATNEFFNKYVVPNGEQQAILMALRVEENDEGEFEWVAVDFAAVPTSAFGMFHVLAVSRMDRRRLSVVVGLPANSHCIVFLSKSTVEETYYGEPRLELATQSQSVPNPGEQEAADELSTLSDHSNSTHHGETIPKDPAARESWIIAMDTKKTRCSEDAFSVDDVDGDGSTLVVTTYHRVSSRLLKGPGAIDEFLADVERKISEFNTLNFCCQCGERVEFKDSYVGFSHLAEQPALCIEATFRRNDHEDCFAVDVNSFTATVRPIRLSTEVVDSMFANLDLLEVPTQLTIERLRELSENQREV